MAAATVHSVVDGWGGDIKRQRVILTAASTNADTLTPGAVGLKEIHCIRPTGRIGTIDGRDGAVTSVVTAILTGYTVTTGVLDCTAAKFEAYIYGK
jgi:hypothetical protein